MWHTLSKQMAVSQPHPPEGTRGEPEGLNPSIAECGAHIKSKVRERQRRTNTWGGEKRGSPRWSCYLCQVNQQAVDLYKSVIPCTRTVTDWNGKSTVLSSSHFTDGTVMGNNTIAFIVMSSIAESSTTGLKLPVLRIPQGRAKQISRT